MTNTLGSRLQAERKAKKLTLGQLGKLSGVSPGMISDLEHDRSHGSTKLHEIAKHLGVNVHWLSTGSGHKYTTAAAADHKVKIHGYAVSEEGAELAAEWEKLHEPMRSAVLDFVEILVAKQVRKVRKEAPPDRRAAERLSNMQRQERPG